MNKVLVLMTLLLVGLALKSWKDQGYIAQTQNQGQCHATWAFAATSVYESWFLYQNTSSSTGLTNSTIDFSEQFILQCSGYGDCSGGSVCDGLSYAASYGLPNETDFGYNGANTAYGIPNASSTYTCTTIKSKVNRVNRTTYVNRYGNISISQMKSMVNNFVVATYLAADGGLFTYSPASDASVPYNCSITVTSDFQLNLPVVVVGYDDSNNLIIQVAGYQTLGGTTYDNNTQTGQGYAKISSSSSYCGGLRKLCQLWYNVSSNTYNKSGVILVAANVLMAATMLIY